MAKRKVGESWDSEVTGEEVVLNAKGKRLLNGDVIDAVDFVADRITEELGEDLVLVIAVGIGRDGQVVTASSQREQELSPRKALRCALRLGLEQV